MRRKARPGLLLFAGAAGAAFLSACGGSSSTTPVTVSSSTSSRSATAQPKLPPPAFAETVNLRPVAGTVLVKLATTRRFAVLSSARQVSVGTVVDASGGTVRLTAATPTSTRVAEGDFNQGIFEIRQDRADRGVIELRIRDRKPARASCGPVVGQGGKREFGSLLGDAHGQFRTRGDFAAATVRGTKWGVRNRCDGTLTIVRRGVMLVTDFRLHKSVTVRAGHSYLARAR